MWISVCTVSGCVSVQFVPEDEGSRTHRGSIIVSPLYIALLAGIGISPVHWGETALSRICAILCHASFTRILDYSDFHYLSNDTSIFEETKVQYIVISFSLFYS